MSRKENEIELVLEMTPEEHGDVQTKQEQLHREYELFIGEARRSGLNAKPLQTSSTQPEKGTELNIGVIVITAITTETISFLFQYIKNRIKSGPQKDYSYEMTIKKGDDRKSIKLKTSNFTEEENQRVIEALQEYIG